MPINTVEALEKLSERLKNDAGILALVPEPKIVNNLPQDTKFPYIRFRQLDATEFDQKGTNGFQANIRIDIWSNHPGDFDVMKIHDAVHIALHNKPFVGMTTPSLKLQYKNYNVVNEPDEKTTHIIMNFNHIFTE